MLFGQSLRDAREEVFVVMVCDGLPMGLAFKRAGFDSKDHNAPANLFNLPRVQERAQAILEARRTTGVVSLAEVTDMLKRVYAGANSAEEYSAAHNAAFSLARLYGHVTERAIVEVRRPSRDPDAPSEQALASWVETLPGLPSPENSVQIPLNSDLGPLQRAPAELLGPEPSHVSRETGPAGSRPVPPAAPVYQTDGNSSQAIDIIDVPSSTSPLGNSMGRSEPTIDWLGGSGPEGRGEFGNGAPVGPVTGTPNERGHSDLLGPGPETRARSEISTETSPWEQNGSPSEAKQVPVKNREKVAIGDDKRRPPPVRANREKVAKAVSSRIQYPKVEDIF
jgi:hypothetical protein